MKHWILASLFHLSFPSILEGVCPQEGEFDRALVNYDESKRMEYYWRKPPGKGPFPVIVLAHGHQYPAEKQVGGLYFIKSQIANTLLGEGYMVASVSLIGYGCSYEIPNFYGPESQLALTKVIDAIKKFDFVDDSKVGLFGYSRGAGLTSMVASQYLVQALAVGGGPFNLWESLSTMPMGIRKTLKREAGDLTRKTLMERSSFFHASDLSAPILIIHGKKDPITPYKWASQYFNRLKSIGKTSSLIVFNQCEHSIPTGLYLSKLVAFFNRHLKSDTDRLKSTREFSENETDQLCI